VITISVIILTFNSETTLPHTLESAIKVSDDIYVVDSFSEDNTLKIARRFGAIVNQRKFINYSEQRNWAIDNLKMKHSWQMHLDSDEILSNELIKEILQLESEDDVDGYFIPRLTYFLGRPIYHGGMFPVWHMRLFRNGKGRCENRRYDQHFQVVGKTEKLSAPMIDYQRMSLGEWTIRHNRWSDMEVDEQLQPSTDGVIRGNLSGNPIEKKRGIKETYYRIPQFTRAFLLFLYRYIFRLGFLDGREGLIFFALQTFWFRFLVDAKIFEKRLVVGENLVPKNQ
jgi:glycosyltransferase involved in cell wall biosynthesis